MERGERREGGNSHRDGWRVRRERLRLRGGWGVERVGVAHLGVRTCGFGVRTCGFGVADGDLGVARCSLRRGGWAMFREMRTMHSEERTPRVAPCGELSMSSRGGARTSALLSAHLARGN